MQHALKHLFFAFVSPNTIWVRFNHLQRCLHKSSARFLLCLTSPHFSLLNHSTNIHSMQTTQANCTKLPHSASIVHCIQVGRIHNTPHYSAKIPSGGSSLIDGNQLPHILENRTHKTTHKTVSSSVTIHLEFVPALLFSRFVHQLLV